MSSIASLNIAMDRTKSNGVIEVTGVKGEIYGNIDRMAVMRK